MPERTLDKNALYLSAIFSSTVSTNTVVGYILGRLRLDIYNHHGNGQRGRVETRVNCHPPLCIR